MSDTNAMREALKLAQPIIEADHIAAKGAGDSDWEGQAFTALEAVNSALLTTGRAAGMGAPGLDVDGICNDHGAWMCERCLATSSAPADASEEEMRRDAARWRALWSSDRIRMMGAAGFDYADDGTVTLREGQGGHHIGLEVWDTHPAKGDDSDRSGRKVLLAYVDARAALNPAAGAK